MQPGDPTSNAPVVPWQRVPGGARWLGLAGLVPFLAGVVLTVNPPGPVPPGAIVQATLLYGAVILSFLGGIDWGAAMLRGERATAPYLVAVIPSLVAWVTLLFVYPTHQAFVLALAFALKWLVDRFHLQVGRYPQAFMRLRTLLTIGAVAALLVLGFLVLDFGPPPPR